MSKQQRKYRYRVTKAQGYEYGYHIERENRKEPDGWLSIDWSETLEQAIHKAKGYVKEDSAIEVVWHEDLGSIVK